ncbi:tudor domain-containing 6 isoform X2 [Mugil cephalus]|uniref:tudor domain-containing 6 isoform X2 n=1 Tax=Mugil cephalus TaxID=48193 RepID=UPI001FB83856|nr:tudor domain-containing 6 isoform X2 [Mugil cephalus]
MFSIEGLPIQGSNVTVLITRVNLHPLCVLVEFWGKFSERRTEDYERLAKDIQSPGNAFQNLEGSPGDQCIVQIDDTWYRSRIVSRNGLEYSVFLIDKGMTYVTTASNLAWGKKEHFQLPSEVEFCLLANVLPLSQENKWSPVALEFLRTLCGKTLTAHVQGVLLTHRICILHIPDISKQMYEMGFSKIPSPDLFQEFVLKSLQSHSRTEISPEVQQVCRETAERLHKQELFMYPELPEGTVETVIVTEVTNPQRIFCQLKVFSQELKKLSVQITKTCESSKSNCIISQEMIGFPCAAKASDGKWYRSVLQQVFPANKVVEVLNVDFGSKQFVQMDNVRPLTAEFFRMPVVTYVCSLHGITDKGIGWTTTQIDYLRSLLLYKTLIARFEYQSISEGVHYVTLYGDNDTNMNNLFGSKESSLLQCEKTLGDYAIRTAANNRQHPAQEEEKTLTPGLAIKEVEKLPAEELALNSSHVAVVQHASNPSQFCTSWMAEIQTKPKAKNTLQTAIVSKAQHPDAKLPGVCRNSGIISQTQTTTDFVSKERRVATFKEYMFQIGSVFDVSVSYIDSPNDFWCQLVQNAGHLKLLMHDIQAHYAGSEFQPHVETACIARHPQNGMWYRALAFHKHETPHVDVLFVDYGQTETVSLYDLRRISPEFLTLHGQAFRCSLLNPLDPACAIHEWNKEAVARFEKFVETAASDLMILKCTVYAVMYSEQKIVFNIVDLETPFESISTSMADLVKSSPPEKAARPSFCMNTHYYSTHNIKIGTEEEVTVTYVNNANQFYCQLERNTDVIKDLKMKVNTLCQQLENVKIPPVFGTLCFAKYTDGQWYRGQIKATKPAILVHFVDYGDTIEVNKSDLLPVPREANDIMTVPVQAVVCGLSDVPAKVPSEANRWFETTVTECKFRALVVAKEPDGKLVVELYHRNTQINAKMKEMFQIVVRQKQAVYQGRKPLETSANNAPRRTNTDPQQPIDMKGHSQPLKQNHSFAPKSLHSVSENDQKARTDPQELYRPPKQRQSCARTPSNDSVQTGVHFKPRQKDVSNGRDQVHMKSTSLGTETQKEIDTERLPKLSDLPSRSIMPGMAADVYISHFNSPLSFYVQFVREEDEIFSLVEQLNGTKSIPKTNVVKEVHPGDLVQVVFAEDSSWYRAVVKEIHDNTMALIEFVDFGNTAVTPISKIGRLQQSFLELPIYSTHCMLSDAAAIGKEGVLDPEVVLAIKEDLGGSEEKVFKCQFIRQMESVWEVLLELNGVAVVCKVPSGCSPDITSKMLEEVKEDPHSLCYRQQESFEGQQLEVYISTLNDDQTFWCQSANTDKLDKITLSVAEVGDAADHKHVDPGTLFPGSPCIALFSDDQLWYRAEVIDKNGDELSVLYVDYGNKSQVNITNVRDVPPPLKAIPRQSFLCELDGFDSSCGSWDSGAADELSSLTADKLLQLTITKVTKTEGKVKWIVQLECEGQVINEAMKTWWKCLTAEDKSATFGLTASTQCDSNEVALPEDKQEHPNIQEVVEADFPVSYAHLERVCSEEHSAVEADPHGTDEDPKLASSTNNSICSEDPLYTDAGPDSPLDENFIKTTDEAETDNKALPGTMNTSNNIRNDSDPDKGRDERKVAVASVTCRKAVKMVPRKAFSPKDRADLHETSDTAFKVSEQAETVLSSFVLLVQQCEAPTEQEIGDGVTQDEMYCVTTVENDSREDNTTDPFQDTCTALPEDTQTAATEPLTCAVLSPETDDDVGEVTCPVEETCSTDVCTDPKELSDEDEVASAREDVQNSGTTEEMVSQEDADPQTKDELCHTLLDEVQNDSLGAIGDVAPLNEMPCVSIPDTDSLMPEDEISSLHEDSLSDLPSDKELPSPDLSNLVEEVTCRVGEISSTDASQDRPQEADAVAVDNQQQVHTPLQPNKDFDDVVLMEDMSSIADDSFEAQLSDVTHLSLLISEISAANVAAEQQPEE